MFLLCYRSFDPSGITVLSEVEGDLTGRLERARGTYPSAFLAEIVVDGVDPATAIPGELDRAITAWNEMTDRVSIHIDKVKNRKRLVAPYRKWKRAIGRRDYLLEQLIPDVEAQPYIWTTIRFPWLLRVGADFNSDKIHARAYGKGGNGNGAEKDYLGLARRVTLWQKEHDFMYADNASYDRAFEAGTGITIEKWQRLKAQFNGNGVGA